MNTKRILKSYFLIFFLFIFLSYHVDAACEEISSDLRTNGNWNIDDKFYLFSGGNIDFTLTEMPCGASTLFIQVISQNGGGNFDVRNFTNKDLNVEKDIGLNVNADKQRQFRIQAKADNLNCPDPKYKGELCYSKFVDTPDCAKEKAIAIGVPIATAIIGLIGGIAVVLIKQYFDNKQNKSSQP